MYNLDQVTHKQIKVRLLMYNLDQVTHKQIKVRRRLLFVCEWLGPGYTSINSGKNALNPYNSVTKFFFLHLFSKFTFGDPQYAHIHFIDVCRPWLAWITKWTNLISYFKLDGDVIKLPIFSNLMAFCI